MKRIIIPFFFLFLISTIGFAQKIEQGWYIVNEGTEYAVWQASYADLDENGKVDYNDLPLVIGEIIFVTESSQGIVYAADWSGRQYAIKGSSTLSKVPVEGKVGYVVEPIETMDGVISDGACYWVKSMDTGSNTAILLLSKGKEIKVPMAKVTLLTNHLNSITKTLNFKKAEY